MLTSRNKQTSNITSVICKPSEYGWCPTDKIEEGISYLNGKDGYTEFGWFVLFRVLYFPLCFLLDTVLSVIKDDLLTKMCKIGRRVAVIVPA